MADVSLAAMAGVSRRPTMSASRNYVWIIYASGRDDHIPPQSAPPEDATSRIDGLPKCRTLQRTLFTDGGYQQLKAQGSRAGRFPSEGRGGAITNFSFHHMIAYSVTLLQQQKANAKSQKHHLAGPCSVDFRMPPYCAI